jgi:hypothetical protein
MPIHRHNAALLAQLIERRGIFFVINYWFVSFWFVIPEGNLLFCPHKIVILSEGTRYHASAAVEGPAVVFSRH